MAAPQSTPLPEAPTRGEAEGQFVPKANAFVGALEPFRKQLQAQADYVNTRTTQLEQAATRAENAESGALDAEATSAANANFAGNWSSLSGSYSVPTSVFHDGYFWALVQNVSDVSDYEPGASSAWVIIQRAFRELSVEPTLSSNFRTGEHKLYGVQDGYKSRDFADIWDVTRASSETVLTPAGRIATVDPDTLPLTYVPETGGLGAQITGEVTNLLLWSEDFTQNEWSKVNGTTIGVNAVTAPDGSANGSKLVEGTGSNFFSVQQTVSSSAELRNFSIFLKSAERSQAEIRGFSPNLIIEVDIEAQSIISGNARIVTLKNGWVRVDVTIDDEAITSYRIGPMVNGERVYEGDGSSGIYIWGAQLTHGIISRPYQKTEASTVTKPATNVLRELGSEFNKNDFSLLLDFNILDFANTGVTTRRYFSIDDNTTNANRISVAIQSNNNWAIFYGVDGGFTNISGAQPSAVDGRNRVALKRVGRTVTAFANGVLLGSATNPDDFNIPLFLQVGKEGNSRGLATFNEISLPAKALPDAELIEWTRG